MIQADWYSSRLGQDFQRRSYLRSWCSPPKLYFQSLHQTSSTILITATSRPIARLDFYSNFKMHVLSSVVLLATISVVTAVPTGGTASQCTTEQANKCCTGLTDGVLNIGVLSGLCVRMLHVTPQIISLYINTSDLFSSDWKLQQPGGML